MKECRLIALMSLFKRHSYTYTLRRTQDSGKWESWDPRKWNGKFWEFWNLEIHQGWQMVVKSTAQKSNVFFQLGLLQLIWKIFIEIESSVKSLESFDVDRTNYILLFPIIMERLLNELKVKENRPSKYFFV